MRLEKEDYRKAVGALKRYNYNCINIINIQSDILSISVTPTTGMPRAPYSIGNTTLNKVSQLEENGELQQSIKEYKAVIQALQLINKDSKYIFEQLYIKSKSKWDILASGMSERTFVRRKSELVFAVHKELEKLA